MEVYKPSEEEVRVAIQGLHNSLVDCQARLTLTDAWIKALLPAIDMVFDVFDPDDGNMPMEQYNALRALYIARHEGTPPEKKENGNSGSN